MIEDPRVREIVDLLGRTAIILERPAVQRQLLVLALVLITAWFISYLLDRAIDRHMAALAASKQAKGAKPRPRWQRLLNRWLPFIGYMLLPISGLLLAQGAVALFDEFGWRSGLIQRLLPIFWLLLLYRLLAAALRATFTKVRAARYIRRFLRPLFILLVIFFVSDGLSGTFGLGAIELIHVMDVAITAQSLLSAIVVLYFFLVTAWVLRDVLNQAIKSREGEGPAPTQVIAVVSYYVIVAVGVLLAAATLGFNLSAILVVAGGLSVGIGFGLQDLVANFVSGIMLLFENSLRPGDIIEVSGRQGTVDQLRPRSTVLRTADNIEIFVPNKSLLTSAVATYTLSSRQVRVAISIGVSYDSNPQEVRKILLEIAGRHGLVLKKPAPSVIFSAFGDSSLVFELTVWIDEPLRQAATMSDLRFMIWREFSKVGIAIPYVERSLHLRKEPSDPEATATLAQGEAAQDA